MSRWEMGDGRWEMGGAHETRQGQRLLLESDAASVFVHRLTLGSADAAICARRRLRVVLYSTLYSSALSTGVQPMLLPCSSPPTPHTSLPFCSVCHFR